MTEVSVMSAQDEACKQEQEVILDSATIGETLKMQHQTLVLLFLSLCDDKTFSKKKPKITWENVQKQIQQLEDKQYFRDGKL